MVGLFEVIKSGQFAAFLRLVEEIGVSAGDIDELKKIAAEIDAGTLRSVSTQYTEKVDSWFLGKTQVQRYFQLHNKFWLDQLNLPTPENFKIYISQLLPNFNPLDITDDELQLHSALEKYTQCYLKLLAVDNRISECKAKDEICDAFCLLNIEVGKQLRKQRDANSQDPIGQDGFCSINWDDLAPKVQNDFFEKVQTLVGGICADPIDVQTLEKFQVARPMSSKDAKSSDRYWELNDCEQYAKDYIRSKTDVVFKKNGVPIDFYDPKFAPAVQPSAYPFIMRDRISEIEALAEKAKVSDEEMQWFKKLVDAVKSREKTFLTVEDDERIANWFAHDVSLHEQYRKLLQQIPLDIWTLERERAYRILEYVSTDDATKKVDSKVRRVVSYMFNQTSLPADMLSLVPLTIDGHLILADLSKRYVELDIKNGEIKFRISISCTEEVRSMSGHVYSREIPYSFLCVSGTISLEGAPQLLKSGISLDLATTPCKDDKHFKIIPTFLASRQSTSRACDRLCNIRDSLAVFADHHSPVDPSISWFDFQTLRHLNSPPLDWIQFDKQVTGIRGEVRDCLENFYKHNQEILLGKELLQIAERELAKSSVTDIDKKHLVALRDAAVELLLISVNDPKFNLNELKIEPQFVGKIIEIAVQGIAELPADNVEGRKRFAVLQQVGVALRLLDKIKKLDFASLPHAEKISYMAFLAEVGVFLANCQGPVDKRLQELYEQEAKKININESYKIIRSDQKENKDERSLHYQVLLVGYLKLQQTFFKLMSEARPEESAILLEQLNNEVKQVAASFRRFLSFVKKNDLIFTEAEGRLLNVYRQMSNQITDFLLKHYDPSEVHVVRNIFESENLLRLGKNTYDLGIFPPLPTDTQSVVDFDQNELRTVERLFIQKDGEVKSVIWPDRAFVELAKKTVAHLVEANTPAAIATRKQNTLADLRGADPVVEVNEKIYGIPDVNSFDLLATLDLEPSLKSLLEQFVIPQGYLKDIFGYYVEQYSHSLGLIYAKSYGEGSTFKLRVIDRQTIELERTCSFFAWSHDLGVPGEVGQITATYRFQKNASNQYQKNPAFLEKAGKDFGDIQVSVQDFSFKVDDKRADCRGTDRDFRQLYLKAAKMQVIDKAVMHELLLANDIRALQLNILPYLELKNGVYQLVEEAPADILFLLAWYNKGFAEKLFNFKDFFKKVDPLYLSVLCYKYIDNQKLTQRTKERFARILVTSKANISDANHRFIVAWNDFESFEKIVMQRDLLFLFLRDGKTRGVKQLFQLLQKHEQQAKSKPWYSTFNQQVANLQQAVSVIDRLEKMQQMVTSSVYQTVNPQLQSLLHLDVDSRHFVMTRCKWAECAEKNAQRVRVSMDVPGLQESVNLLAEAFINQGQAGPFYTEEADSQYAYYIYNASPDELFLIGWSNKNYAEAILSDAKLLNKLLLGDIEKLRKKYAMNIGPYFVQALQRGVRELLSNNVNIVLANECQNFRSIIIDKYPELVVHCKQAIEQFENFIVQQIRLEKLSLVDILSVVQVRVKEDFIAEGEQEHAGLIEQESIGLDAKVLHAALENVSQKNQLIKLANGKYLDSLDAYQVTAQNNFDAFLSDDTIPQARASFVAHALGDKQIITGIDTAGANKLLVSHPASIATVFEPGVFKGLWRRMTGTDLRSKYTTASDFVGLVSAIPADEVDSLLNIALRKTGFWEGLLGRRPDYRSMFLSSAADYDNLAELVRGCKGGADQLTKYFENDVELSIALLKASAHNLQAIVGSNHKVAVFEAAFKAVKDSFGSAGRAQFLDFVNHNLSPEKIIGIYTLKSNGVYVLNDADFEDVVAHLNADVLEDLLDENEEFYLRFMQSNSTCKREYIESKKTTAELYTQKLNGEYVLSDADFEYMVGGVASPLGGRNANPGVLDDNSFAQLLTDKDFCLRMMMHPKQLKPLSEFAELKFWQTIADDEGLSHMLYGFKFEKSSSGYRRSGQGQGLQVCNLLITKDNMADFIIALQQRANDFAAKNTWLPVMFVEALLDGKNLDLRKILMGEQQLQFFLISPLVTKIIQQKPVEEVEKVKVYCEKSSRVFDSLTKILQGHTVTIDELLSFGDISPSFTPRRGKTPPLNSSGDDVQKQRDTVSALALAEKLAGITSGTQSKPKRDQGISSSVVSASAVPVKKP